MWWWIIVWKKGALILLIGAILSLIGAFAESYYKFFFAVMGIVVMLYGISEINVIGAHSRIGEERRIQWGIVMFIVGLLLLFLLNIPWYFFLIVLMVSIGTIWIGWRRC